MTARNRPIAIVSGTQMIGVVDGVLDRRLEERVAQDFA